MTVKHRRLALAVAFMVGTFVLFEFTHLDTALQDPLWDPATGDWPVENDRAWHAWVFYNLPRWGLMALAATCLWGLTLGRKRPAWAARRRLLGLLLMVLVVAPTSITVLKRVTRVPWPSKLARYGGDRPYVRVLEPYPESYTGKRRNLGWPASHAGSGFTLMMLWFALDDPRRRRLALAAAIVFGWTLGVYQILRGAHFLGHTVFSFALVWFEIVVLHDWVVPRWFPSLTSTAAASPDRSPSPRPGTT